MSDHRGEHIVALIHGTPAAMAPAADAIAAAAPGARVWHLMDDRLMADADEAGGMTPDLERRMSALIDYAVAGGAEVVQLTCSMYGSVADGFTAAVPVRASDAAMLDRLAHDGPARIALLATLSTAAEESAERIARATGGAAEVVPIVIPGALDLVRRRAFDEVAALAAASVASAGSFDAVVLAQYSLGPIAERLGDATGSPVYSPVHLMADELHGVVDGQPQPEQR